MPRLTPARFLVPSLGILALFGLVVGPSAGPWESSPAHAQGAAADLFDPTIVRDYYLSFHDADWEQRLGQVGETGFVYADLVVDGTTYADVGLRLKGNSSSRGPGRKKPLNLTLDAKVAGQDLMGYDTLNLNSGFADPTLVREVLTAQTLRPLLPMPKTAFVRVHINGDYFGVYDLVQQIEGTFLDEWFDGGDTILFKGDPPDGGGMAPAPTPRAPADQFGKPAESGSPSKAGNPDAPISPDQPNQPGQPGRGGRPDLRWLGEDIAAYKRVYELKTAAAGDAGYEKLREMIRVLDAPVSEGGVADDAFPEAIRRVLDVDGALWYIAAQNLYTNYDSYYAGHNFFLVRTERDARFHILSWDINESFGVFPGAGINPADRQAVAQTDPFLMATGNQAASRPLIRRLLAVPEFRADYLAHYRTLVGLAFKPADLEARVTAYHDLIRESVRTDPNLLYSFDNFSRNVWEDVNVGRAIPGLLAVARDRATWLAMRDDLRAPDATLAEHLRDPEAPTLGDEVRIAARFEGASWPTGLDLVYQVDGGPPVRVPFMPGDVTYFASIPAQPQGAEVSYFFRASFADGRAAFFPEANWTAPWRYTVRGRPLPSQQSGDLVINEVMADNKTIIADAAGQFADWVEIYNRGSSPIRLAGHYLSDKADEPKVYAFPDVLLAPGAYFLVWCDNDPNQGSDHADFKLSKEGDDVFLSTETATVDSVAFGLQQTDVSWGRTTDGAATWASCTRPSPRAANGCGAAPEITPTPASPTPASPTPDPFTATPTATRPAFTPVAWNYLPVARRGE